MASFPFPSRPKPRLLRFFLGFLTLSGILAAFCYFQSFSGRVSELLIKFVFSAVALAAGSLSALPCVVVLDRRSLTKRAIVGVLASGCAVVVWLVLLWIFDRGSWETGPMILLTFGTVAGAAAHSCLLELFPLDERRQRLRGATNALIVALAMQIVVVLWLTSDSESLVLSIGVTLILVALCTLAIPICSRLDTRKRNRTAEPAASPDKPDSSTLTLHQVSGDIFRDESGRTYRVRAEPDPNDSGI